METPNGIANAGRLYIRNAVRLSETIPIQTNPKLIP